MIESLKARFIILTIAVALASIYFLPNFIPLEKYSWWPVKNKLIYGLDIQGGLHLVLSADVDEIIQERLSRIGFDIQEKLLKENITVESTTVSSTKPFFLFIKFQDSASVEKARLWMKKSDLARVLQTLGTSNNTLKLSYYETRISELKEQAIKQSIEVIRNRIDEFGVSEPLINAQGDDRILVQTSWGRRF